MADTLFTTETPGLADVFEGTPVTVGITVVFDTAGTVTGARFYGPATIGAGTYEAAFWQITASDSGGTGTGTLLANATFASPTGGVWNSVNFSSGVSVDTSHAYAITLRTSAGRYTATSAFFASSGLTNLHMTAVQDGGSGGGLSPLADGRFTSGLTNYPASTFNSNAYFVDPLFVAAGSAATPGPLLVTSPMPSVTTRPIVVRSTLADPPVLTTRPAKVITVATPPAAPAAIVVRSPQPAAAIVSGSTTIPLVVTTPGPAPSPQSRLLRATLADPPVLTTVAPMVITTAGLPAAGAATVLRTPLAAPPTPGPIVVSQPAAADSRRTVILARTPLAPVLGPFGPTTPPIVVTGPTPTPTGLATVLRTAGTGICDPFTHRPYAGITARPNAGVTARPHVC